MNAKKIYKYLFVFMVSLFVLTGCGSDNGGGEFVALDKIPITNTESEDNITILDSTVVMISYSDIQQILENNETTYSKSFTLDDNKTEVKISFDLLENNVTEDIQIDVEKLDYKEDILTAEILKFTSNIALQNVDIEVNGQSTNESLQKTNSTKELNAFKVSSMSKSPICVTITTNILDFIKSTTWKHVDDDKYIFSIKTTEKFKNVYCEVNRQVQEHGKRILFERILFESYDYDIEFNSLDKIYTVSLSISVDKICGIKNYTSLQAYKMTSDFIGLHKLYTVAEKTLKETKSFVDVTHLNNFMDTAEHENGVTIVDETVTHRITDFDKLLDSKSSILPSDWIGSSYGSSPKGDDGRMPLILVHGWNGDPGMTDPSKLLLWENAEYHYWHNFLAYYLTSEELQKKYHIYLYRYTSYKHVSYSAKVFKELLNEVSSTTDLGKGLEKDEEGITIMAHSMGGMVSRAMIEEYEGLGKNAEKLKKLITLDTPHRGSVGSMDNLLTNLPKDLDTHGAMDLNYDNFDNEFNASELMKNYNQRRSGKTRSGNGLDDFDTTYCQKLGYTLSSCRDITANPYMKYLNDELFQEKYNIYNKKYIFYTAWHVHDYDSKAKWLVALNVLYPNLGTSLRLAQKLIIDLSKNNNPKLDFINNGVMGISTAFIGNYGYAAGGAETVGSSILASSIDGETFNPKNSNFSSYPSKSTNDLYHKDLTLNTVCTEYTSRIITTGKGSTTEGEEAGLECTKTKNISISLITDSTGKDHYYGVPYRLFWEYDHETIFNGTAKGRGTWDDYIKTGFSGKTSDTRFKSHRADYIRGAMKIRYGQEPDMDDNGLNTLNPLTYEPVFLTIEKDLLYSVTNGDIDEDKLPDIWEEENGLRWVDATDALEDSDDDGLTNLQEYNAGVNSTSPEKNDSDGDGFKDGVEINEGTNPNDSKDYPQSELTQPTNLTATATTNTITLKWDKVENASSYEICMAEEGIDIITKECTEQNGGKIFNSDSVEKKITDNLVVGTTYYFRVRGVNGNNGIWSDEVNATAVIAGLEEGAFANPEVNTEHNVKNVGLDITDGTLKLSLDGSNTETTFPFIWVANSGEGTISKLSTTTGEELGRYKTGAGNGNPSRTTVDQDGNVWVGNRDNNTITKVGLKEWDQCIDRNDNGVIDTSTGATDVKAWSGSFGDGEGIANAEDECILQHVTLYKEGVGSADAVRLVAIDPDNNVFAGGYSSNPIFKINGVTGEIINAVQTQQSHYGGVVDKDGNLWSMSSGSGKVQKISNDMSLMELISIGHDGYGITIDKYGKVWTTEYGSRFSTFSPLAPVETLQVFKQTDHWSAQGIVSDANGDIFIAGSLSGSTVGQYKQLFDENGIFTGVEFVKNHAVQSGPTGVAVDGTGKVWVSNYYSNSISRIDPVTEVVEHFPIGFNPYNYSDMTGNIVRTITKRQGTWEATFNGKEVDYPWNKVSWKLKEALPQGTSIHVFAKVDNREIGLNSKDYVEVSNREVLSSLTGQYLKLKVELSSENLTSTPEVIEIQLY